MGHTADDNTVREAITMAVETPAPGFGLRLRGAHPIFVTVSYHSLGNAQSYDVVPIPPPPPAEGATACAKVGGAAVGGEGEPLGIRGASGVVLSPKKATLPRVIIACLGTGR